MDLSVRYLVEFIMRSGSIDSRFSGLDRVLEGGRIHRLLQKQAGGQYEPEVSLSITHTVGEIEFKVSGRADGVIAGEDGLLTVDEIKTITTPIEYVTEDYNPAHWGQGCCYGHILCQSRDLPEISVQLTYYQTDTDEIKRFIRRYSRQELADFFNRLLAGYERWALLSLQWQDLRTASLKSITFPFSKFREGQRKLAAAVYRTIVEKDRLYCSAPTGIGKTMSTLFPAVKAMGEGYGDKIFYLTAKTVTRQVAEEAVGLLRGGGNFNFKTVTLTAKDKICFLDERNCIPELCPYADGYFDRINDALYEIICDGADFNRQAIEGYAKAYRLCPYELSLDLSNWCDCVICDYNYLFDPVVYLQRYFEGKGGNYIFLVDEAHNLVDRSREMYSARLSRSTFRELKKLVPKEYKKLQSSISGVISAFLPHKSQCEDENADCLTQPAPPEDLIWPLQYFLKETESFLEDHRGSDFEKDLLAVYFDVRFYEKIRETYDKKYVTLIYSENTDVTVKLFCRDPSDLLDSALSKGRGAALFSATLSPLDYYRDILGGRRLGKRLELLSPFQKEQFGLFVADTVSTKYAHREQSLENVIQLLGTFISGKAGNYIAYFPSYAYMQQVYEAFTILYPGVQTVIQTGGMRDAEREAFLLRFDEGASQTLLGFCVLGGIYSEGIDLTGSRLIGSAVVGVGLPKIGPEPDVIRDYFNEENGMGFAYAYQYPGMNKVLQAVGRVIRTEKDRGVVLLIDQRFTTKSYLQLFPPHWSHFQRVTTGGLAEKINAFWRGIENT